MGLFSSKPKESEWVEWHPNWPVNKFKRTIYDEKTDSIKGGTMWTAGWDFSNYNNVLYAIDQIISTERESSRALRKSRKRSEDFKKMTS